MISIYRESKAVITILIPMRIMVMFDHVKDDITTSSTLGTLLHCW